MEILNNLLMKLDRRIAQERENNPHESSVDGWFMFGIYKVEFDVSQNSCNIIVSNVPKDIYLENVSAYLEEHCICWDDIDIDLEVYDFWDDHGFRDEADYMRYRYG